MKSTKIYFYTLIFLIGVFSCNTSDDQPDNTIIDDYNLLVVDDLGRVYEIGNNTGEIIQTGIITKQIDGTFLNLSTIVSSEDKIYATEYFFNPGPANNLLVFDKESGTTEIVPLEIPNDLIGNENAIAALATYGSNLLAVLTGDYMFSNNNKYIVSIDLESYEMTNLGVIFNEDGITSLQVVNDSVFITTGNEGFLEVDFTTNSVNNLEFSNTLINGGKLAVIDNNRLALMQFDHSNNILNDFRPIELNLVNQTYIDKSDNESWGYANPSGTSIYKNNEYINLFSSAELEIYYGILKCNFETDIIEMVTINATDFNRNMIIVGTVD